MKKVLIYFIILSGCTSNQLNDGSYKNFNISETLNFVEFKLKLQEYAINKPYPNIDE